MLDVVIIGGGICGCSLLYQLSKTTAKVALVEKENDVGVATTKANSAIVHAGYDPEPGTLMARYNVEGNAMIEELCHDLDVLYRKTGSLVIGFDEEDEKTLAELYERGKKNGVPGLQMLQKAELHAIEPGVSEEARYALYAPSAAVVNPWELASAQAEVAVQSGAQVFLSSEVTAVRKLAGGFEVETTTGVLQSRFVVNAAGTHADIVAAMAGDNDFTIAPNKGEYFLLDTTQGELVQHVVFQCPTKEGKGVLVAPTVHGNLIVGPTAQAAPLDDVATTAEGLAKVQSLALRSVPSINFRENIRNFAGLRAIGSMPDFIVGPSRHVEGLFHIAGIKSPGLTAAPAIAKDMVGILHKTGLHLQKNEKFVSKRKIVRFKELTGEERQRAIQNNPLYGKVICRCQTITEGEIVDALHRPLPPRSLDAVKRKCGPGMGRCQGGFCGPRVQAIIARELGIAQQEVPQDREGMYVIAGETKQGEEK